MRLIDADALNKAFDKSEAIEEIYGSDGLPVISEVIDAAPTIDAEPVRHGKTVSCSCSVCGWKFYFYEDDIDGAPYCAVCGAKMDIVSPLYQREVAEP